MNDNTIIVFGTIHHNTLSMVRSLGEAGLDVVLLLRSDDGGFVSKSKYVKKCQHVKNEDELVQFLLVFRSNHPGKGTIITCDDMSAFWIDSHYDELVEGYNFFNAGGKGRIASFLDKEKQNELAKKIGCNVPKSIVVKGGEKAVFNVYPCLIKPQESINGGKQIHICQNQTELNDVLSKIDGKINVLVEEYLDKESEIVVLGVSYQGQVIVPGHILKIRENKGGTTYSQVFPIGALDDLSVAKHSKEIIQQIGYEGLFGIEFIHNNRGYFYIETNLRNDATCYALAKAGVNLPKLYVDLVNGKAALSDYEVPTIEPIYAMVELKDFRFVMNGKVSFFKWLKQRRGAKCLFYYSKNDKAPFWSAIKEVLTRPFRK